MYDIQLIHSPHVAEKVPVGTLYGIGLNYSAHIEEMKSQRATEPVVFIKPATALVSGQRALDYPDALSQCVHHEVELVLLLGHDLWQANAQQAQQAILGVGVGLDLTLRDRQQAAKAAGRPWAVAKGFKGSAPVSPFVLTPSPDTLNNLSLTLEINQELRQQGNTRQMLFSCVEIVQYLSSVFALRRGDLIFTGTPEGVGELHKGDQIKATLENHCALELEIR